MSIKFMSALQKATRNSGRRRRAPTKSWHCIWLESAIRTLMGWVAVAHMGSMDPRGFFTFRTIERRVYGISCMGFCDISTFECAGNVENVGLNEYTLECISRKRRGCKLLKASPKRRPSVRSRSLMIGKRTSHKSTFVDIAKVDRVLFWQSCTLSGFSSLQCGFRHSFRINRASAGKNNTTFQIGHFSRQHFSCLATNRPRR